MVLPTLTPAGYLFPAKATSQRLNTNFGRIHGTIWQANSAYHALQASVAKAMSHGIQFRGAYTWSKSIDTLSATSADDSFPNGLMNPLFFDQRIQRGLSDFNVGQNLVVNLTWQVPGLRAGIVQEPLPVMLARGHPAIASARFQPNVGEHWVIRFRG